MSVQAVKDQNDDEETEQLHRGTFSFSLLVINCQRAVEYSMLHILTQKRQSVAVCLSLCDSEKKAAT